MADDLEGLLRRPPFSASERIGKHMARPILALDRLSFLEREGRVGYRHGDDGAELERMDYMELIARMTSHIPDRGQVMVRYRGLYETPDHPPTDSQVGSISRDGHPLGAAIFALS